MLREIYIENFALIEKLNISLSAGLNVLTGETGAGKSIIIDAVGLLLGDRASSEFIREGEERAVVQGFFSYTGLPGVKKFLDQQGITPEEDDTVILVREITRSGKNLCRINGRVVTLNTFEQLGHQLVDIHGQHDHQSLLSPSTQLLLLDNFGGPQLEELRREIGDMYNQLKDIENQLQALRGDSRERARQIDLLQYQLDEISQAQLVHDEEEKLQQERTVLNGAEKLAAGAQHIYGLTFAGEGQQLSAYDLISSALAELEQLLRIDGNLQEIYTSLETAVYALEDAARAINDYASNIEFDPDRLAEIEQRLDTIQKLKLKYGATIPDILAYQQEIAATLAQLEGSREKVEQLELKRKELAARYTEAADRLTANRKAVASRLEQEVTRALSHLGMKNCRFALEFRKSLQPGPAGTDQVEFQFSANPGEPLRNLSRIASGGEMARVMLALKSILAEVDAVPTLIFDEIDSGIGGMTITHVARKLAQISRHRQVICVTHSAPIASFAETHLSISKEVKDKRTFTKILTLSGEERIGELTRMLGGSQAALEHARQLIAVAEKEKAQNAMNR